MTTRAPPRTMAIATMAVRARSSLSAIAVRTATTVDPATRSERTLEDDTARAILIELDDVIRTATFGLR